MRPKFDEKSVLQLLSQGNEDAFTQILDAYQDRVFGIAFRYLKSRENSKEIVQEVFLKVWNRRIAFSEARNLEAFIFTATKNLTINYLEKLSHERSAQYQFTLDQKNFVNNAEQLLVEQQNEELLQKTLQLLPHHQMQVYQLARVEGLTYEEIANRLSITVNTVKYHMKMAHKFLRVRIVPHTTIMTLPILVGICDHLTASFLFF
jgi:RNA polymerase sigma-70 factor (ECF subfamily)